MTASHPHHPPARAELATARQQVADQLAWQRRLAARIRAPALPLAAHPLQERDRLAEQLRGMVEFFAAALAPARLAADATIRVDGRSVAPEALDRVLQRLRAGPSDNAADGSLLEVAGTQVRFRRDPHRQAVAVATTDGRTRDFTADSLAILLWLLQQPPGDAVAHVARMQVALDRLTTATQPTPLRRPPEPTRLRRLQDPAARQPQRRDLPGRHR
ncbi:hypothetical protein [Amycolatopsis tolypomycina]|uniref:hypothetical protein n=1 Tax=Amycolatopsis tolypomycina TaxID=208445 RepID=UPI0033B9421E